jgi:membrane-bound lytic murein transglycosylase MltF
MKKPVKNTPRALLKSFENRQPISGRYIKHKGRPMGYEYQLFSIFEEFNGVELKLENTQTWKGL